jgi:hypothetical protein
LFVVLPNAARSSDDLSGVDFQYIEMTMKKIRGRQGRTHRVVSEHHDRQDGWYDDPKNKRKRRSSNDLMRNRFPTRSLEEKTRGC